MATRKGDIYNTPVTEQEEAKQAVHHAPETPLHGTSKGKGPTYQPQSSQQTENDVLRRRLEDMQAQIDQLLEKQHQAVSNAKKHIETEFRQGTALLLCL